MSNLKDGDFEKYHLDNETVISNIAMPLLLSNSSFKSVLEKVINVNVDSFSKRSYKIYKSKDVNRDKMDHVDREVTLYLGDNYSPNVTKKYKLALQLKIRGVQNAAFTGNRVSVTEVNRQQPLNDTFIYLTVNIDLPYEKACEATSDNIRQLSGIVASKEFLFNSMNLYKRGFNISYTTKILPHVSDYSETNDFFKEVKSEAETYGIGSSYKRINDWMCNYTRTKNFKNKSNLRRPVTEYVCRNLGDYIDVDFSYIPELKDNYFNITF